jgi:hypothetical protein
MIALWVVWLHDNWYLLSLCEHIICNMEFGLAVCLTDPEVSTDFVFRAEWDVFLLSSRLIENNFNFTCGFLRSRCNFSNQHILETCVETGDLSRFAVNCWWQFIRQLHSERVCYLCLRCTFIEPSCDRELHAKKLVLFCFLLYVSLAWFDMSFPNWDFFVAFKKENKIVCWNRALSKTDWAGNLFSDEKLGLAEPNFEPVVCLNKWFDHNVRNWIILN